MTSKLKCPVCQQDLGIILCDIDDFICSKCRMCGDEKLWKALIQAKQDLEKAKAGFLNIRSWCGVSGLSGYVPTICEQQIKAIEERIKNEQDETA